MIEEIEEKLSNEDVEIRRQAVLMLKKHLGAVEPMNAVRLLLMAMQDASWRVRKTAVDILLEEYPVESYINGLIKLLYLEDNAGARNSAMEALTRLGRKITDYLIEAFDTSNNDVRKFIIDIIGHVRDKKAVPLLIEALKDEDENVRASAVENLGNIKEALVVDALIDILESDDLWTAYPAAEALGRIGDRRAVPALLRALDKSTLREPALRALSVLGDGESLERIVRFITDKSKAVQQEALRAIEMLYHKGVEENLITGTLRKVFGDKVIDILLAHATSSRAEVRGSAILLLGLLKDEKALIPLLELSTDEEFAEDVKKALLFIGKEKPESLVPLFKSEDPTLKRFICDVAADIASPVYYDIMIELLRDEDGHVRSLAAKCLSNIGDYRAVNAIKELLTDPYIDVQESAVEALSMLKDGLDIEEIMKGLHSENPVLRKNTALLLGRLALPEMVPALGFALKDDDVSVRQAVVKALSLIDTEDSMEYLIQALTDEVPEIRVSAALSLGARGREASVEHLCLLLEDSDDMVRVAASKALGMLGRKEAVPNLVKLLSDENGFVVTSAIDAIGKLGGEEAREALIRMLSSEDKEIRRTAIKALSGFQNVEYNILPFIKDEDWATRVAAVEVLGGSSQSDVRKEIEKMFDEEEDPVVRKVIENYING
jgi:HEAT repeat protein